MRKPFFAVYALLALALLITGRGSHAQTLFVNPPQVDFNEPTNTPTLQLIVDRGIESAVGWGTTITLRDPVGMPNAHLLDFLPFSDGKYFHQGSSVGAFFDTDLSPNFVNGSPNLTLTFVNTLPDAILGQTGRVILGEFRIQINGDPGHPLGAQVALAPLDYPPFGSAVVDATGDNLLIGVNGANVRSPAPEPSAIVSFGTGIILFGWLSRRTRIARKIS